MAREGSPSDTGLYESIEKLLKNTTNTPQTCVDLFEKTEIRSKVPDVNKLSDALGHLWRRGYIKRQPAPKSPHHQARWAYWWPQDNGVATTRLPKSMHVVPAVANHEAHTILSRPTMTITDDGRSVEIQLPDLVIRIAAR